MSSKFSPVLIIGGSGVVGSQAARAIRRLYPDLPLAIGGRDLGRAQVVARELSGATGVRIDLERADLGLPDNAGFSAVVIFVKDERLTSMRYAQKRQIPYVSVSSGTFEIGPEVAQYIHAPDRAPILLASHWLAGAAIFPVLDALSSYETVDAIRIGVLLDEEDMGGPAALADYNRITGTAPASLTVKSGKLHWVSGEEASARYTSVASNLMRPPIRPSTSWRWLPRPVRRRSVWTSPTAFPPAAVAASLSRRRSCLKSKGRRKTESASPASMRLSTPKDRRR